MFSLSTVKTGSRRQSRQDEQKSTKSNAAEVTQIFWYDKLENRSVKIYFVLKDSPVQHGHGLSGVESGRGDKSKGCNKVTEGRKPIFS